MCILLNSILRQLLTHFLMIVTSNSLMKLNVLVQVTLSSPLITMGFVSKFPNCIPIYKRGIYNTTVNRKPIFSNYREGYIQAEIIIAIRNVLHNWEMRCSTWKVTKHAWWGCSDRSRKAENRFYGWDGTIYSVDPEIGISCRQYFKRNVTEGLQVLSS